MAWNKPSLPIVVCPNAYIQNFAAEGHSSAYKNLGLNPGLSPFIWMRRCEISRTDVVDTIAKVDTGPSLVFIVNTAFAPSNDSYVFNAAKVQSMDTASIGEPTFCQYFAILCYWTQGSYICRQCLRKFIPKRNNPLTGPHLEDIVYQPKMKLHRSILWSLWNIGEKCSRNPFTLTLPWFLQ